MQRFQAFAFRGERGIRTPGTVIPYDSLANCWFKPLTHLSVLDLKSRAKISRFLQSANFFAYYFFTMSKTSTIFALHNRILLCRHNLSSGYLATIYLNFNGEKINFFADFVLHKEKITTFTKSIVHTIWKFIYV